MAVHPRLMPHPRARQGNKSGRSGNSALPFHGRAVAAAPPNLPPNNQRDGRSPASHAHTLAPAKGTNQGGAATPPYLSMVGRSLPRRPNLPPNNQRDGRSPASHAHTLAPAKGTNQGGAATPPYLSMVGRSLPRRPNLCRLKLPASMNAMPFFPQPRPAPFLAFSICLKPRYKSGHAPWPAT